MSTLSFIQVLRVSLFKFYFLFTTAGLIFIRFCDKSKQEILQSTLMNSVMCAMSNLFSTAHATSCQVYPSEYAYRDDSVSRVENPSANCRRYPPHPQDLNIRYTHCDGSQLQLTDSNLGQEQYSSSDYYVWSADRDSQLLFIFPIRVSLTTITLHYYSDNVRGLSRLRFYAVPDDFDIWETPTTTYPRVAVVPLGGESAGHRNVSININFNTRRVLMYKFSSSFHFAVSEVEFFACNGK